MSVEKTETPEKSGEVVRLRALATRAMPLPVVRGSIFYAPVEDAPGYIESKWAEELPEEFAAAKAARSARRTVAENKELAGS